MMGDYFMSNFRKNVVTWDQKSGRMWKIGSIAILNIEDSMGMNSRLIIKYKKTTNIVKYNFVSFWHREVKKKGGALEANLTT